jgi:demethylmenaquinone methyltransferase / 2-methoxy-6-polyprenyl-1,4-benzoquinol methylase
MGTSPVLPTQGAKPGGAVDEESVAAAVREMFDGIAPRYDVLNHVLSIGIVDRLWWWRAARRFREVLARPDAVVLDLCCGTGDMTLALVRRRPEYSRPILAADFSHQMLVRAAAKFIGRDVMAIQADALHLPIPDNSVDLITIAFGFRNLANYRAGLDEFHRVLRPGGELGILDFSEPGGPLGKLLAFYFRHILPAVGNRLSGLTGPLSYSYLPGSVRIFPRPAQLLETMQAAGFRDGTWTPYTSGMAGLYRAVKR